MQGNKRGLVHLLPLLLSLKTRVIIESLSYVKNESGLSTGHYMDQGMIGVIHDIFKAAFYFICNKENTASVSLQFKMRL